MQHRLRKKRKRDSLFYLLVISVFMNFGVAMASQDVIYKETRPLKKVFEDQKKPEKDESEKKESGFIYDPTGKTDPFKSFIAVREEVAEKEKRKPRTYLETVDLSQLDLILILIGAEGKRAMVRDSKGIGHVIKEGTAIGTNGGVVHEIKEGEVIIREEYKDFRGRTQHKDIVKKSPSSEE
jgi:type IV pilus assembly protein PilP